MHQSMIHPTSQNLTQACPGSSPAVSWLTSSKWLGQRQVTSKVGEPSTGRTGECCTGGPDSDTLRESAIKASYKIVIKMEKNY